MSVVVVVVFPKDIVGLLLLAVDAFVLLKVTAKATAMPMAANKQTTITAIIIHVFFFVGFVIDLGSSSNACFCKGDVVSFKYESSSITETCFSCRNDKIRKIISMFFFFENKKLIQAGVYLCYEEHICLEFHLHGASLKNEMNKNKTTHPNNTLNLNPSTT